jgi:hypothetical protein
MGKQLSGWKAYGSEKWVACRGAILGESVTAFGPSPKSVISVPPVAQASGL